MSHLLRTSRFALVTVPALAAVAVGVLLLPDDVRAEGIEFERDIAPVFEQRCLHCHGADAAESGLRLDLRASLLRGGDSGLAAIVPGEPEKSYLIDVINHVDEDMAMPMGEDKLPEKEIELLTRWVKQGADWPGQMNEVVRERSDHWSFQPIKRSEVPSIGAGSESPIDAFLLKSLAEQGLSFSEPAPARSLIRRASIVLTGLPPTPGEVEEFVKDHEKDSRQAYAELVDRLLASPHFGERWAQHWLDVIRWAETNGSESNMYRKNAWTYRDYVVRAFNNDKPYDEFLFEQFAGDTMKQGYATGFLVSGPHVPIATVGREPSARRQARADRMDEILQTVGASALGMTIGCARCHNHKFDPISIQDYYAMSAVFQDIEFGSRFPEIKDDHPRRARARELNRDIRAARKKIRGTGPWEENWIGHKELRFQVVTAKAVRFTFNGSFVQIDEAEIFDADQRGKNWALASTGTETDHSEEITAPQSPVTRINDGSYGNDSWMVRVPKGSKQKPWVQFNFREPHKINRIRLSTNREDYFETDYLEGLYQLSFDPYTVEVLTESGDWERVIASAELAKLNEKHKDRAAALGELQGLIAKLSEEGPRPSFVARFIKPSKTHVFGRGSPENPREEVFAAGLSELGGDLGIPANSSGPQRRRAFAKWMSSPGNPLTARVAANRLWHHVFGRGVVATTSDFGAAGAPPTHPELLDWLASELKQPSAAEEPVKPWSMKHLIRLMVMSDAFRQSSLPNKEALKVDAGSALLWRFPPKRVEAEVIRDSILQASGKLDGSIGGRGYRIHNVKKRYAQWEVTDNHGPDTWRRMIYQERMRRVDDQMFTAFDFPDCGQVRPKRPVSTTPLQALNLMNSQFVLEQSALIADRATHDAGGAEADSVDRCFELLLGRTPVSAERGQCVALAKEHGLPIVCRALINSNEFAFLP